MYPIYFKDMTCVKCGGKIDKLDVYNNPIYDESNKDIRTVKCNRCGAEYILHWDSENDSYPTDRGDIELFKKDFNK